MHLVFPDFLNCAIVVTFQNSKRANPVSIRSHYNIMTPLFFSEYAHLDVSVQTIPVDFCSLLDTYRCY